MAISTFCVSLGVTLVSVVRPERTRCPGMTLLTSPVVDPCVRVVLCRVQVVVRSPASASVMVGVDRCRRRRRKRGPSMSVDIYSSPLGWRCARVVQTTLQRPSLVVVVCRQRHVSFHSRHCCCLFGTPPRISSSPACSLDNSTPFTPQDMSVSVCPVFTVLVVVDVLDVPRRASVGWMGESESGCTDTPRRTPTFNALSR